MRVNSRLLPSCQFFFHYEVTRVARVYKHAATNENSLDLNPSNRKLALVEIIPNYNQIFSSRCGFVAQWLERATGIRKALGSIPGGAALCFFV